MMTPKRLRERADAMERGLGVTFGDTPAALRKAANEIERLHLALGHYGDHTYECDLKNGRECTCGYDAALTN